jgi:hypothetical protein
MTKFSKQDRAALEAVARHFAATWEEGDGPPDIYFTVAGKRIAVELTAMKQPIVGRGGLTTPHLRFDRVAVGLIGRLQAALHESVPDGKSVILTITAPIRLPGKTAGALEEKIRTLLAHGLSRVGLKDTINGNQVHARIVKSRWGRAAKVIGFVHNPDSDPDVLFGLTHSVLDCIGAAAGTRAPPGFAGHRWLVVRNEHGLSHIQTYRRVYSQLSIRTDFKRILMVLVGGRVETLTLG